MAVKYMNVEQLAEYIGVKPQTIYRWRSEGASMPRTKKAGKFLRWTTEDVDVWMDASGKAA